MDESNFALGDSHVDKFRLHFIVHRKPGVGCGQISHYIVARFFKKFLDFFPALHVLVRLGQCVFGDCINLGFESVPDISPFILIGPEGTQYDLDFSISIQPGFL